MGNDAVSKNLKSYYFVPKNEDDVTPKDTTALDIPKPLTQDTSTNGSARAYIPTAAPAIKPKEAGSVVDNNEISAYKFEEKCLESINLVLNKQLEAVKDLHQQLINLGKPNAQNAKKAAQVYLIFHHEVQAYKQHLKTQQTINQSLTTNNSLNLASEDDLNNILTQFSSSYDLFKEFFPKIAKQDIPKKIDSEIERTTQLINTLKDDINNNILSVNPDYKNYIASLLAQINKFENLTHTDNEEKNLSNIDILSMQVKYAIKLKEIKDNLFKLNKQELPKSYLVLQELKKLKSTVKNQNVKLFNLNNKDDLLKDIKTSIRFQKGKFNLEQNSFIPSLETPVQIGQEISIPNSIFSNKNITFIRNMKNFSLPNHNTWQKFDDNTKKVNLQNTQIIFHKQKRNYCGISSLKNYFQTSLFKNCIDILSKKYDLKTYNILKASLNNIMNRNDINPKISVAISLIANKLKDIKLEDGLFNQDNFNITQEEFKPYENIFTKLFDVNNAKDLTAKIINYIKPSYNILRSFSEDVDGAGIDLSKASEIFSRYSILSNGKINGSVHIPASRFLDKDKIFYAGDDMPLWAAITTEQKSKIADVLKDIHVNSSLENKHLEEIKEIIGNNANDFIYRIKKYHQELNAQETENLIRQNGVILSGHNGEGDYSHGHYICIQTNKKGDKYFVMNSLKDSPEEFNNYEEAFQSGLNELSGYQSRHIWVEDK